MRRSQAPSAMQTAARGGGFPVRTNTMLDDRKRTQHNPPRRSSEDTDNNPRRVAISNSHETIPSPKKPKVTLLPPQAHRNDLNSDVDEGEETELDEPSSPIAAQTTTTQNERAATSFPTPSSAAPTPTIVPAAVEKVVETPSKSRYTVQLARLQHPERGEYETIKSRWTPIVSERVSREIAEDLLGFCEGTEMKRRVVKALVSGAISETTTTTTIVAVVSRTRDGLDTIRNDITHDLGYRCLVVDGRYSGTARVAEANRIFLFTTREMKEVILGSAASESDDDDDEEEEEEEATSSVPTVSEAASNLFTTSVKSGSSRRLVLIVLDPSFPDRWGETGILGYGPAVVSSSSSSLCERETYRLLHQDTIEERAYDKRNLTGPLIHSKLFKAASEMDAFGELWPQLKKSGWTSVPGSGLVDYFYLMPGVTKKTAKKRVNMYTNIPDVLKHVNGASLLVRLADLPPSTALKAVAETVTNFIAKVTVSA